MYRKSKVILDTLFDLIRDKVTKYQPSTQNQFVFLYTSNKRIHGKKPSEQRNDERDLQNPIR